jgi:SpoVK/Ycf46/Vps4 family AAA+-type ATPase
MSDNSSSSITNLELIEKELEALKVIIKTRIKSYFDQSDEKIVFDLPNLEKYDTPYSKFLQKHQLNENERIVFLLALAREVYPLVLDPFLTKNTLYDLRFTEFGGISNDVNNSFIPTLQTALFLICGDDKLSIVNTLNMLSHRGKIFKVNLFNDADSKNIIDRPLYLSNAAVNCFLNENNPEAVTYATDFPATLLETDQTWDDLVFSKFTTEHLEELDTWLLHHDELLDEWNMAKYIRKGYKALFYGPPGTGKSLTATLLGKKIDKVVYRIDLSQVVSKYIGETEKKP